MQAPQQQEEELPLTDHLAGLAWLEGWARRAAAALQAAGDKLRAAQQPDLADRCFSLLSTALW